VRKVLITLAILIVCTAAVLAAWIVRGRQLSLRIDRFRTVEIDAIPIRSIAYEGSGTGGTLIVNDVRLSLNDAAPNLSPSIGSTKGDQFALASGGKVFAFGPLASAAENGNDHLATATPAGDHASLTKSRSVLSWIEPFDFNFMTGHSPSWKRHMYYQLRWKKASGATLEMLWRYEQHFNQSNGWGSGFMTREGATGLIRIDIQL